MSKGNLMMLQMLTSVQPENEVVDKLIKSLTEFKEGGYKKDERPMVEAIMMVMKWEQGEKSLEDVLLETVETTGIIEEAVGLKDQRDAEKNDTISEEEKVDRDIIITGEHGVS